MDRVLEDTRILECGRGYAVGLVGTLLGDMGAEVIRYEEPGSGDPLRTSNPPLIEGIGPEFLWSARNKKSITLNLETRQGQKLFKELVDISDVVTENFRPGMMDKWGLAYDDLRAVNPGIIVVSITPYGQTGPYANNPAADETLQAHSGFMSISGDPDGPAVLYGVPLAYLMGGFQGVYATLSALYHKGVTGIGQHIDISMFEALAFCHAEKILHFTKHSEIFWRLGSRWTPMMRSYPAKDGDVFILSGAGKLGISLFEVMGREDVFEDPKWPEDPFQTVDEEDLIRWDAMIEQWTQSQTVEEIVNVCVIKEIMVAPVQDVADLVNDPHYIARGALVDTTHPVAGNLKFQGSPVHLSQTPGKVETPAPQLGEHNEYVYCSLLDYSKDQINTFVQKGVI